MIKLKKLLEFNIKKFIDKIFHKKESEKYVNFYMKTALEVAQLSRAVRLKVGCVVVKDGSIISHGWNGTPRGFDNNCEEVINGELKTKSVVVHSEINALSKIAKSTNSSDGATMYLTHSPCYECSKAIIQSGIREVYYSKEYRDSKPLEFLKKAGIPIF